MTKLKWRLSKLPTPDEVRELVKDKIITQDEAREILFGQEQESEVNIESLEEEIKFLRKLVEKLSTGRSQIVETIRYVEKPYTKYPWWNNYETWCMSANQLYTFNPEQTLNNTTAVLNNSLADVNYSIEMNGDISFSNIKTF